MRTSLLLASFLLIFGTHTAEAREQIRAVGSSTVYPFVTSVVEEFSATTPFPAPVVESTGTGGGIKLFCGGVGGSHPDIANASRAIKKSEVELCAGNGIKNILEIKLGYDGIVLANAKASPAFRLSLEDIFQALARKIPHKGELIDNPHQTWKQVNPSLPDKTIEMYGPPPTSGTRDAFAELVMEKACEHLPEFIAAYPDQKARGKACQLIREDGRYIEAGENDNLIVQKLTSNPDALGIFGFSFLEQNMDVVQGSIINGREPTFENIRNKSYPISRPLYVYVKGEHFPQVKGLKEFTRALVDSQAIGEEGYLIAKGIIPLSTEELEKVQNTVEAAIR